MEEYLKISKWNNNESQHTKHFKGFGTAPGNLVILYKKEEDFRGWSRRPQTNNGLKKILKIAPKHPQVNVNVNTSW